MPPALFFVLLRRQSCTGTRAIDEIPKNFCSSSHLPILARIHKYNEVWRLNLQFLRVGRLAQFRQEARNKSQPKKYPASSSSMHGEFWWGLE